MRLEIPALLTVLHCARYMAKAPPNLWKGEVAGGREPRTWNSSVLENFPLEWHLVSMDSTAQAPPRSRSDRRALSCSTEKMLQDVKALTRKNKKEHGL